MRLPDRYEIDRFFRDHGARIRRATIALVALVVVLGAGYWYFEGRTRRPPSIFDTPVDDVASFFVSDDFNRLSVQERMELIGNFVKRFQGLTQSESAVLSAFMAGLTGKTMDQLRLNVRILARDFMKEGASGYFSIPPEERATYLDQWLVEWMKFGERMERGEERAMSDEQRLAMVKRDAARGREREAQRGPDASQWSERDAVRIMDFWRREVESVATPAEQGQIMRFMQDLRRHVGG